MEIRPTGGYPGWASGVSGAAGITEPTQTQKNLGWQAATAPPAAYFNWFQNKVFQWTKFFDDKLSYDDAIADDFVSPSLLPQWTGTSGCSQAGIDGVFNAVGAVQVLRSVNGTEGFETFQKFRMLPNDWTMQFWTRVAARGNSGSAVDIGWANGPHFWLGASGNWAAHDLLESHIADLGVSLSASGYQKLEMRYTQAQNLLEMSIDDKLVYGASHAAFPGGSGDFIQVSVTRQGADVQVFVDRARLGVRR